MVLSAATLYVHVHSCVRKRFRVRPENLEKNFVYMTSVRSLGSRKAFADYAKKNLCSDQLRGYHRSGAVNFITNRATESAVK